MSKYNVMRMLAQASNDENLATTGGNSGDQTGYELNVTKWKANNWRKVYRFTDTEVAEQIADWCVDAVLNGNIGYDNYNRASLFAAFPAAADNWDVATLATVAETDCSALLYTAIYNVTRIAWDYQNDPSADPDATSHIPTVANYDYYMSQLRNAGYSIDEFDTDAYLTSEDLLIKGDIIRTATTGSRHIAIYV